jgi:anti-anti-sigma factor
LKIDEYRGPDSFRLRLEGSLDQATAPLVRERLPNAAAGALEIDLAACSYISSAGLRLLLEIDRAFQFSGNLFRLLNVSPFIENILETTGLAQLLSFTRARREIFLQDRGMMAAGTCGECYRLDEESVMKLY